MGLTFNGNIVSDIYVGANFNGLNFDFPSQSLPVATTYFSAYLGTYTLNATYGHYFTIQNVGQIDFTPTSLTISAVPEPSTYAAIFGALALGLVVWKRRRAA